ncbi:LysR family transcriptional regulator [Ferrimonas marina]|uniref:DNA-binding transcriptional regulator, LysR family n=1 Tax=Ferrimonas marina TaxID=299255 RepID=A0A1M5MSK8_9GAMM|nr:LysR family transcriptional regulator [Ferrimonas marina]SHG80278.1 DNA-binding transcriptional regulator, LysR family [Ferrimonas marina]
MNRIPFGQLEIFLSIARHGSIRGAARALAISAPSVSQGLKLLESHLGLPLFIRTTRQIELTEAGRLLLEQAGPAHAALTEALVEAGAQGQAPSGKVRLTLPRFVYRLYFHAHYAEFCRRFPQIELEVSVDDRAVDLIEQGYDLGIRLGDRVAQGMVAKRISPPMAEALFASPDYLAAHGTPDSIEALRQHRLIQYRFIASNQVAPLMLQTDGEPVRIELPNAMVVNDTDLMVDAALQGLGIGRIVTPAVKSHFNQGTLVPVLPHHWHQYPGLHLYFPQGAQKAQRVRALIDFLSERPLQL